jgi:putative transposase
VLLREDIAISMDGRGRALDNIFVERLWRSVKYEDIYLKGYNTIPELVLGLTDYFAYYNNERPHQSLAYRTPHTVYATGMGGGARIVNKWSAQTSPASPITDTTRESSPVKSGQHCSAANLEITA